MKCLVGMILLLLLPGAATLAQSAPQLVKIDSSRFLDEGGRGIQRLVQTLNLVLNYPPCKYGCEIKDDIKALEKEISRLKASNLPVRDLEERLLSRTQELRDLWKTSYRKKEKLLIEPIRIEIQKKLETFAADRKYAIVDTMSESVLFVSRDLPDVTAEFVVFCNQEFARNKD